MASAGETGKFCTAAPLAVTWSLLNATRLMIRLQHVVHSLSRSPCLSVFASLVHLSSGHLPGNLAHMLDMVVRCFSVPCLLLIAQEFAWHRAAFGYVWRLPLRSPKGIDFSFLFFLSRHGCKVQDGGEGVAGMSGMALLEEAEEAAAKAEAISTKVRTGALKLQLPHRPACSRPHK